jgi:hypothetical protein
MTGVPLFIGLRMSTYDTLSEVLEKKATSETETLLAHGISGCLAGMVAVSIYYPLDVLRRIMHLNGTSKNHNYSNVFDAIRQTF